jgi:signal transduction histidine kinase
MVQVELLTLIGRLAESITQELRTPLTIIGDSAEIIGRGDSTPPTRETARNEILAQVERMNALVGQLLVLSQGASSSAVLDNADCSELVKSLIMAMRADMAAQ